MRQRTGLLCAAARLGLVAACSPGLSLARAGDSTQIFGRIQTVMRERLGRLPDYTCDMEVRRLWSTPRRSDWLPMDQWHLELTVIGGKEMYGRPGEHEMRYEDIARLIPNGTIGVGEFAVIAENLFFTPNPAVRPWTAQFPRLLPASSNCGADHLLGDNRFPRNELRLQ